MAIRLPKPDLINPFNDHNCYYAVTVKKIVEKEVAKALAAQAAQKTYEQGIKAMPNV
jgi:hypothetical protein